MTTSSKNTFWFHFLAMITVVIWGTTFISTKMLLKEGLSSASIMLLRFLIAYICIWPFTWKSLFAKNLKDEFLFLVAGLSGGSLYFLSENTALSLSLASNVALIVCTAPILTALLFLIFRKEEQMRLSLFIGSTVAFLGVALVIYSGGVRVTNYIYFIPIVALLSANLFLGEQLPVPALGGALLIVAGIYLAR